MNIRELRNALNKLEAIHGDVGDVMVYYRQDYDSDVREIGVIEEDLYEEDNKTLFSVSLLAQDSRRGVEDEEDFSDADTRTAEEIAYNLESRGGLG